MGTVEKCRERVEISSARVGIVSERVENSIGNEGKSRCA